MSVVPIRICLMAYLCTFNVCLFRSSKNKIRNIDFYILDKLFNRLSNIQGLPLANLVIQEMRKVVEKDTKDKSFEFLRLITLIFQACLVDLRGESVIKTSKADVLTNANLKNLKYKFDDGRWYFLEDPYIDYDIVWP